VVRLGAPGAGNHEAIVERGGILVPVALGISAGTLVGIVSGFWLLVVLSEAYRPGASRSIRTARRSLELLALPLLWSAVPLAAKLLVATDIVWWYILTLTIVMLVIALFPLWQFVLAVGNEIRHREDDPPSGEP
jgi:hypothetical protein